jgi:hypothetical protein
MAVALWRRAAAEAVGTALLVATVVGSGIAAEHCPLQMSGCSCWRTRWRPAAG